MVAELPGRMGKPMWYILRSNSDTSYHPLQSHCFPALPDKYQAHSCLPGTCTLAVLSFRNALSPDTHMTCFLASSRTLCKCYLLRRDISWPLCSKWSHLHLSTPLLYFSPLNLSLSEYICSPPPSRTESPWGNTLLSVLLTAVFPVPQGRIST